MYKNENKMLRKKIVNLAVMNVFTATSTNLRSKNIKKRGKIIYFSLEPVEIGEFFGFFKV